MTNSARTAGAILTLIVLAVPARAQAPARPPAIAITHVTVIDGNGGPPATDRTVLIENGRITRLGPFARIPVPAGTTIVRGRGRFLIPGLWDMHVHEMGGVPGLPNDTSAAGREHNRAGLHALMVSHGITGIRDMAGRLPVTTMWRDAQRRGTIIAPRMFVTGEKMGHLPVVPGAPFPVRTPDDVRRSVAMLKAGGADFVKIGDELLGELLPVAIAESRRVGLDVVGHPPGEYSAREASDAGMRSIEHLLRVVIASDDSVSLIMHTPTRAQEDRLTLWDRAKRRMGAEPERYPRSAIMAAEYSEVRAENLMDDFVKNGTWHTPTLRLWRRFYHLDPKTGDEGERRLFAVMQHIVWLMQQRGVRLLAGTDADIPGASLHDELGELVAAGLTPMQALQAATRNPAEFLRVLDTLGTVEQGKVADLVLLDADPLLDIANTRRINAVFLAGRLFRYEDLELLLEEAHVAR